MEGLFCFLFFLCYVLWFLFVLDQKSVAPPPKKRIFLLIFQCLPLFLPSLSHFPFHSLFLSPLFFSCFRPSLFFFPFSFFVFCVFFLGLFCFVFLIPFSYLYFFLFLRLWAPPHLTLPFFGVCVLLAFVFLLWVGFVFVVIVCFCLFCCWSVLGALGVCCFF